MKKRYFFLVFIIPALFLADCGKKSAAAPEPAKTGKLRADRYEELLRPPEESKLTVYFLDLSVSPGAMDRSGDAMILVLPGGKVMMVDSGHPESAADSLKFLSDLGIGKIDYFILSHPHIDHIGGFPAIAEKHEIGELFHTELVFPFSVYRDYLKALELHNIETHIIREGDSLSFGEVTAEVFNPPPVKYPPGYPARSTQFINDNSLVIKFTWGESSLLLGADIYLEREKELVKHYGKELRALVAKANHHGSGTSNGSSWIRAARPRVVVALYDYMANMKVYRSYKRRGADFYHPYYDGVIRITMDKEGNFNAITRFDSRLRE